MRVKQVAALAAIFAVWYAEHAVFRIAKRLGLVTEESHDWEGKPCAECVTLRERNSTLHAEVHRLRMARCFQCGGDPMPPKTAVA